MNYKNMLSIKKISSILTKKLRKVSISKRLLMSFITLSIVPIFIIFIVINTTSIDLIEKNIISNDKIASNLIVQAIGGYMDKFDSITNEIIWNSSLLKDIKNHNELIVKEKEKFYTQLSQLIRSRTSYVSDIADFTILDEDFQVVYNEGFSYINHSTKLEEIKNGIKENKIINWTSINKGESNYIAITKPIKVGQSTHGYLFLALKEKVIVKMFNNYNVDFNGYGVLMDDNNNIMVTNNEEISIEEIRKANELKHKNKGYIKLVKNIDNSTQIIKINNEKFIITNTPIRYASWSLIGIIPYKYIYMSCANIYKIYFLVSIVVIALSILISMLIHKSITNPINEIINTMSNINENTIGDNMKITGNDEISFIMKKYNNMSKKIKTLLSTIKIRENEKREVTLRMLQAQINPHFLFNTLGGLRYVAMMNQDNIVANGLEALAKLLRSTIVNKDDFINIEDEIENVFNYITIQKIRYGDIFDVRFNIDKNLKYEKILKFILQPIVENCILHGFEENENQNFIDIIVCDKDEFIYFEILDNGVGITEDKLKDGSFDIDKFAGIGVKNIKERLNIYYEGIYTFEIISSKEKGTRTKILIPKIAGGILNESTNS
ncbi:sensor histidine kinase [Romboutsia lituseburensis]|uniref:sensor histidine kinase n=1 Tax=Romboutsia lituseburensis TaxID=1537 RepID=UPI00215B176F|nr:sensor histidine kinase [Romboutsia lituseburensis]MCR8744036.1 sensor histidine kinase [Romboutsia lituseburensis]